MAELAVDPKLADVVNAEERFPEIGQNNIWIFSHLTLAVNRGLQQKGDKLLPGIHKKDLSAGCTFKDGAPEKKLIVCIVLGNNHPSLGTISPRTISEFISPDGFVFDYWNHYSHLPPTELGDSYFAVGRSGKVVERV